MAGPSPGSTGVPRGRLDRRAFLRAAGAIWRDRMRAGYRDGSCRLIRYVPVSGR